MNENDTATKATTAADNATDNAEKNGGFNGEVTMMKINMGALGALYSLTDAQRFPTSQMADGLERAESLYWADFTVADAYGINAVKDTFFRTNYKGIAYKMLTELVIVLNHKIWEHYERAKKAVSGEVKAMHDRLARLYNVYWEEVSAFATNTLKGDEAVFYYRVTD